MSDILYKFNTCNPKICLFGTIIIGHMGDRVTQVNVYSEK